MTEALKAARAAAETSVLIMLDLLATFDTVNHRILLSVLLDMGVSGKALSWFESYLAGHSFHVSRNGHTSLSNPCPIRVQKGLALGPLLFATYTTCLDPTIRSLGFTYYCYTDDTDLYHQHSHEMTPRSPRGC